MGSGAPDLWEVGMGPGARLARAGDETGIFGLRKSGRHRDRAREREMPPKTTLREAFRYGALSPVLVCRDRGGRQLEAGILVF